ncbi:putative heavy-metal-binding-domain-containing protein [Phaeosphaeriaceae sp. PMI808]|nr:putative heavy-metal-binding-domain-containing protein [Phaeosphaeriaceae sp. PMI808]
MLTNRRSTMVVPPNRMPSWHPQSKPYPSTSSSAPVTFDTELLASRTPALLTTTTATLPAHRMIRTIGTVHGTTTCTRKDTKSFIKSIASSFGSNWGEAKGVTSIIYHARDQAIDRMVKEAVAKGANAIVGWRSEKVRLWVVWLSAPVVQHIGWKRSESQKETAPKMIRSCKAS